MKASPDRLVVDDDFRVWQRDDWLPEGYRVELERRMRAAGMVDGDLITARVAEQFYPKVEWLARP